MITRAPPDSMNRRRMITPVITFRSRLLDTLRPSNDGKGNQRMAHVIRERVRPTTLETASLDLLDEALERLELGFKDLPDLTLNPDLPALRRVLLEVAERMQDNFPYHHPLYVGQMLKPPHPIARLAYTLALWLNPNNHDIDGGRASSAMEREAVADLGRMFGWDETLGHLCGGGTVANLEALWIARALHPGKTIVASEQSHYIHRRNCELLNVPFQAVASDQRGRMDVTALRRVLGQGDVGTVIVTLGSTATGSVDPLPAILELQQHYGFRIHVDASYGGYFTLVDLPSAETRAAFARLSEVDSIVIDPHKHGLQPYGCGCVLFKDPSVASVYRHDSPYTYFSSDEPHLGEISFECSRAGAAAVALWATQRLLPLTPGGEFALGLANGLGAAQQLFERIAADERFVTPFAPELDVLVWSVRAGSASEASRLAQEIYEQAAQQGLHLALAKLPRKLFASLDGSLIWDQEHILCLRACLIKPELPDWIEPIWRRLDAATNLALAEQTMETLV
jgi:tyrosine decarboxylase / aspartate 1-decarboxylase